MALEKVEYTDKKTVVSAKNMNDIQDAIIALENKDESNDTFLVWIYSDTASHNALEILQAFSSGKRVFAIVESGDLHLSLLSVNEGYATFVYMADEDFIAKYLVNNVGDVEYYEDWYAMASNLGDITAALEEIREYAKGLIEGGGTA